MARLTAAQRRVLPASDFAGADRSYPVNDRTHQQQAIRMAGKEKKAGRLSPAQASRIKAKAERLLNGGS